MDLGAVELNGNSTVSEKTEILTSDAPEQSTSVEYGARIVTLAFALWLVISTMLFVVSAFRILRFHWLLKVNSRVHHDLSTSLSADVASQLGLRERPNIVVATANIAPFA